jgi:hypothetical protein
VLAFLEDEETKNKGEHLLGDHQDQQISSFTKVPQSITASQL